MHLAKRMLNLAIWLILILYCACNIYVEHSGNFLVPIPHKLLWAAGFILLWSLAMYHQATARDPASRRATRRRQYVMGLALYYTWILCNMLFFDAVFGRSESPVPQQLHFYQAQSNFIPLKTIRNYLFAYARGKVGEYVVAVNLLGNLVAFAPLGFFMPALFPRQRKLRFFVPFMVLLVCAVEYTQWRTASGSCDIDDLILNTLGALIFFCILKLPPFRRMVNQITKE